jgi:hypothetical protein
MPHWVYLLGRKFVTAFTDAKFQPLTDWLYWNRRNIEGHCYYAHWNGRKFCLSQSRQPGPDKLTRIANVLRNGDAIDTRVGPFSTIAADRLVCRLQCGREANGYR